MEKKTLEERVEFLEKLLGYGEPDNYELNPLHVNEKIATLETQIDQLWIVAEKLGGQKILKKYFGDYALVKLKKHWEREGGEPTGNFFKKL